MPAQLTRLPSLEGVDEAPARRDIRDQVARLEATLGRLRSESFPRRGIDVGVPAARAPGIALDLGALEALRDRMAAAVADARAELDRRHGLEADRRRLIGEMEADPSAYKWVRVSNLDIGEPGCRHWHAKPRWGILGAIMGWWRVKISSGCPLGRSA